MRWVPALKVNFFASWSFHFSYFFAPSIQTSRRWIPAGELPLAFTSTGEVTLALAAGPQILAARLAELGGAQVVNALVLSETTMDSSLGPPLASITSWRESRFRSRAIICAGSEMGRLVDSTVKAKLPEPRSNVTYGARKYWKYPRRSMFWSPFRSAASSCPPATSPIWK